jgi:putative membrane protein
MTDDEKRDPRYYLAAERTFLAWMRTGLSLMGFGFVVARFGFFLKEFQIVEHETFRQPTGFSVAFGTALVMIGTLMNIVAAFEHVHTVRKIKNGEIFDRPSYSAILIASILTFIGAAMAAYLLILK